MLLQQVRRSLSSIITPFPFVTIQLLHYVYHCSTSHTIIMYYYHTIISIEGALRRRLTYDDYPIHLSLRKASQSSEQASELGQKDKKTKRQQNRKTKRQKKSETKGQKDGKTKRGKGHLHKCTQMYWFFQLIFLN